MNFEDCTDFQILISADFDDDLNELEQDQLRRHLNVCPSCRDWRAHCQQISEQVASVARVRSTLESPIANILEINGHLRGDHKSKAEDTQIVAPKLSEKQKFKSHRPSRWFWGVAAVLLVAIGMSFGIFSRRRPEPSTLSVEPIVAMHAINLQAEQDQQATVRAVGLELRMMKLEMKQVDLEPSAREQMEKRIDSLLAKTRELDASTQILYQGE